MRNHIILLCFFAALYIVAARVPLEKAQKDEDRVDGEYIAVFREDAKDEDVLNYLNLMVYQKAPVKTFEIGSFKGVITTLTPEQLELHLQQDKALKYIEENMRVRTTCTIQSDPIWNLERISERTLELLDREGYTYDDDAADTVTSYVVDTGIRITHNEFTGRASWGTNTVDSNDDDCNGHGTHVAGTIGGTVHGLAKKVNLVAVKVLNCAGSGTNAGVILGIEWVAKNAVKPANANMSLGGGNSKAVIDAVEAVTDAGIVMVVAAGNSDADACGYSPANAPSAITVGSTTVSSRPGSSTDEQEDLRSSFSNFGSCLDIFAPGSLIKSAWITSRTSTNTISGTSMASPHVCGIVSLIQAEHPTWSVAQVTNQLISLASSNIVDLDCGSSTVCAKSPNRFLYNECA